MTTSSPPGKRALCGAWAAPAMTEMPHLACSPDRPRSVPIVPRVDGCVALTGTDEANGTRFTKNRPDTHSRRSRSPAWRRSYIADGTRRRSVAPFPDNRREKILPASIGSAATGRDRRVSTTAFTIPVGAKTLAPHEVGKFAVGQYRLNFSDVSKPRLVPRYPKTRLCRWGSECAGGFRESVNRSKVPHRPTGDGRGPYSFASHPTGTDGGLRDRRDTGTTSKFFGGDDEAADDFDRVSDAHYAF